MVFKLVRTDTTDPCKIQLPVGVHKFGRGVFLDCEDKRVSRSHGQLDVKDDSVILKALHQNPCFYIRKGSEDTEILRIDCSVPLGNGDKFGLLPGCYWYEILHCTLSPDINRTESIQDKNVEEERLKEGSEKISSSVETNAELDESVVLDFQLNETLVNPEGPESPSLILPVPESTDDQIATSPTQDYQADTNEVNQPSKRPRESEASVSPEDGKKIKIEPQNTASSSDGNLQAGPSNPAQPVKVEPPASPVNPANNPPLPLRERCMYGAQCYRKNPQHKAQFSHPSDSDWGTGLRGVCPHGASCVKRDPRHWRDHDHPPGANPPAAQRPGNVKTPKKRRDSTSSEDREISPDTEPDLPSKRMRKPVKRQSWSDSESEMEDPFMSDGSVDEWQPSSNVDKGTQDTQSP